MERVTEVENKIKQLEEQLEQLHQFIHAVQDSILSWNAVSRIRTLEETVGLADEKDDEETRRNWGSYELKFQQEWDSVSSISEDGGVINSNGGQTIVIDDVNK